MDHVPESGLSRDVDAEDGVHDETEGVDPSNGGVYRAGQRGYPSHCCTTRATWGFHPLLMVQAFPCAVLMHPEVACCPARLAMLSAFFRKAWRSRGSSVCGSLSTLDLHWGSMAGRMDGGGDGDSGRWVK